MATYREEVGTLEVHPAQDERCADMALVPATSRMVFA